MGRFLSGGVADAWWEASRAGSQGERREEHHEVEACERAAA
jgi:hypothetical protein